MAWAAALSPFGESNSGTSLVTFIYINFVFPQPPCSFPFVAPLLRFPSLPAILTTMHGLYFALSALLAFATVHAKPQGGTPSGAPSSSRYKCHATDIARYPLVITSNDGSTLFCSYGVVFSAGPYDYYCKYSAVSFQSYPHLCLVELTRFDRLPAQSPKTTTLVSVPALQLPLLVTAVVALHRRYQLPLSLVHPLPKI